MTAAIWCWPANVNIIQNSTVKDEHCLSTHSDAIPRQWRNKQINNTWDTAMMTHWRIKICAIVLGWSIPMNILYIECQVEHEVALYLKTSTPFATKYITTHIPHESIRMLWNLTWPCTTVATSSACLCPATQSTWNTLFNIMLSLLVSHAFLEWRFLFCLESSKFLCRASFGGKCR